VYVCVCVCGCVVVCVCGWVGGVEGENLCTLLLFSFVKGILHEAYGLFWRDEVSQCYLQHGPAVCVLLFD
jgi:hypothetical protein